MVASPAHTSSCGPGTSCHRSRFLQASPSSLNPLPPGVGDGGSRQACTRQALVFFQALLRALRRLRCCSGRRRCGGCPVRDGVAHAPTACLLLTSACISTVRASMGTGWQWGGGGGGWSGLGVGWELGGSGLGVGWEWVGCWVGVGWVLGGSGLGVGWEWVGCWVGVGWVLGGSGLGVGLERDGWHGMLVVCMGRARLCRARAAGAMRGRCFPILPPPAPPAALPQVPPPLPPLQGGRGERGGDSKGPYCHRGQGMAG
ncbi:unnamed protein product [Closterium sp. Naga37s-1]|nr:unnamed protein product [Closterium sp. Naga37s-1]